MKHPIIIDIADMVINPHVMILRSLFLRPLFVVGIPVILDILRLILVDGFLIFIIEERLFAIFSPPYNESYISQHQIGNNDDADNNQRNNS